VIGGRKDAPMLVGLKIIDECVAGIAEGRHLFVGQEVFEDQVSFIVELPRKLCPISHKSSTTINYWWVKRI